MTTEQTYRTLAGDMLDAICKKHYGAESPATEVVLEANPGLAEYIGQPMPSGLTITLPAAEVRKTAKVIRLWD